MRRFAANPLYHGIRISSARSADPANAAARDAGLKLLAASGLVLDINRGPATPGISAALAENHPDLTVIINHCGNPGDVAKPLPDEWKSGITDGAARKNVFIKVSALVEGVKGEPGMAPTDPEYDRPVSDPIWNAFGPDRLIYGRNWPVSDRGAPHGTVVGIVEAYFDEKGAYVSNKFFAGNSRVAYRWQERARTPPRRPSVQPSAEPFPDNKCRGRDFYCPEVCAPVARFPIGSAGKPQTIPGEGDVRGESRA